MKTTDNKNTEIFNTNPSARVNNGRDTFAKHSHLLNRPISSFEELYGQKSQFSNGKEILSCPHMIVSDEANVKVIAYDDANEMNQSQLIEAMGENRLFVSVKHHATRPDSDPKEKIKLQCTHAQLVVRSGNKVCSYNNPQDYQNGMFGSPTYPMIFLVPVYPRYVTGEEVIEYQKNTVVWATLLNTYSKFPGDYNGGDPLSVKSKDEAIEYGNHVLNALAGDQNSMDWIKKPSNHLYCAELVYLSLTLGAIFPLTAEQVNIIDYSVLENAARTKDFLRGNSNPYINKIDLELPHKGLKPMTSEDVTSTDFFGNDLAVRPMLFSDMITAFVKYSVNRAKLGESSGKYQYELLQSVRPMINSMMPGVLSGEVDALVDKLEIILRTEHESYQKFRSMLGPVLEAIDSAVENVSNASNTFIPPHTFLVRSLEYEREGKVKGLIGMKYLGHGVHKNLV